MFALSVLAVVIVDRIAWLAVLAWHMSRVPRGARPDRLARTYARLCAQLARAGLPRASSAGPLAYARWIARERPEIAPRVRPLIECYLRLRYLGVEDAQALEALERSVARLKLRRPPRRARASRESADPASAPG